MKKYKKSVIFCGNSPACQVFVKIFKESKFLWKFSNQADKEILWYISSKSAKIFGAIFQQNSAKFFTNKKKKKMEGIKQQNSVIFGENFRKIYQTAKISTQQCCYAARVFVTLICINIGVIISIVQCTVNIYDSQYTVFTVYSRYV